jgi:hypothetical protein
MKPVIVAVCGVVGLGTVAPLPVRTSPADEYFPAADRGALMWTQDPPKVSKPAVYARRANGTHVRVSPRGTTAFSVGISGHQAVYLQLTPRIGGHTAFRLYDLASQMRRTVRVAPMGGDAVEGSFADGLLLYGWHTFAGQGGIQLRNISTGTGILLDRVLWTGQVVVGGVNRNFTVWKKCVVNECGIYLFDIARHTTIRIPNPAALSQSAPSVLQNGTVYLFEGKTESCSTSEASLVRYGAEGSRTVLATFAPGVFVTRTSATVAQGMPTVYFDRGSCTRSGAATHFDVYKVLDVPQPTWRAIRMSS